jgi:hypothetical protein
LLHLSTVSSRLPNNGKPVRKMTPNKCSQSKAHTSPRLHRIK